MELETLLGLLYSAADRSNTVQATVHRRHSHARELELLRARGWYRDPPRIQPEEGDRGEPADVIDTTTRLWAARPHWFRWESTFSDNERDARTEVGVKEGELFWHRFDDGDVVRSNEDREGSGMMTVSEELVLDPAPLLGTYKFEIGSLTTLIGRHGIEVAAHQRVNAQPHLFGPLSGDLHLVIDEERGVLLRSAVVVEREEISISEVVYILFDEPISADLFRPLS